MKNILIHLFSICLLLFTFACNDDFTKEEAARINKGIVVPSESSAFDFFALIGLQANRTDYSTEQLLDKYSMVTDIYEEHKYAKAAKGVIIFKIVDNADVTDLETIHFLLKEIEKFERPYSEQTYFLLELGTELGMKPQIAGVYGTAAYNKAMPFVKDWEESLSRSETPSENDVSATAELYRGKIKKIEFAKKLKKYLR